MKVRVSLKLDTQEYLVEVLDDSGNVVDSQTFSFSQFFALLFPNGGEV